MKSFIFFIVILVYPSFLFSQELAIDKSRASDIVKSINESILSVRNFSANLHYSIYKHHSDTVAFERSQGFYKRNNENEHSMLLGVETIQNGHERLMVDTSARSIMLTNPNPQIKLIDENMNHALRICKKITLQSGKEKSVIRFYPDQQSGTGFSAIEIEYSNDNFFIQRLTLFYINAYIPDYEGFRNPKVEITYSDISTSRVPTSEFDISLFVEKRNNVYTLSKAYGNYDFFNQLNILKSKK